MPGSRALSVSQDRLLEKSFANDLGIATGASRLTNQIGTAIGIALVTMAYGGDPNGFDRGFLLGAVFAAVSAIGSLFVLPQRETSSSSERNAR